MRQRERIHDSTDLSSGRRSDYVKLTDTKEKGTVVPRIDSHRRLFGSQRSIGRQSETRSSMKILTRRQKKRRKKKTRLKEQ